MRDLNRAGLPQYRCSVGRFTARTVLKGNAAVMEHALKSGALEGLVHEN